MDFKVYPLPETFGNLEFVTKTGEETEFRGGKFITVGNRYTLLSSAQREELEVILPITAGEKHFNEDDLVELVEPRIVFVAERAASNGYVTHRIIAQDIRLKK